MKIPDVLGRRYVALLSPISRYSIVHLFKLVVYFFRKNYYAMSHSCGKHLGAIEPDFLAEYILTISPLSQGTFDYQNFWHKIS